MNDKEKVFHLVKGLLHDLKLMILCANPASPEKLLEQLRVFSTHDVQRGKSNDTNMILAQLLTEVRNLALKKPVLMATTSIEDTLRN